MAKHRNIVIVLSAVFVVVLGFNNCSSDVEFSQISASQSVIDLGEDVEQFVVSCANAQTAGKMLTLQQTLNFADTKVESGLNQVCPFAQDPDNNKSTNSLNDLPDANGNFTMLNNYLRSRYEQYRPLNLPAGAVVCSVELSAPEQEFQYDDMFYFTLNDYVLASSLGTSLAKTNVETALVAGKQMNYHKYNWAQVANSSFEGVNNNADDYCAGKAEGFSSCNWPLSQQLGEIKLEYGPEMLAPVSLKSNNVAKYFGFIVTGDDDPNNDCHHQNLDLSVKAYYYIPSTK